MLILQPRTAHSLDMTHSKISIEYRIVKTVFVNVQFATFTFSSFLKINAGGARLAMGPTQPPIQWIPAVLSPGIKR
jgi:hypothetical protein